MQPQVCTATPRRSLLGNGFFSSCCSECREEDGPVKIRGGDDDPSDVGDESDDPELEELDDAAVADMAAGYEAEQNVIDQERREEEKEEQNAAQEFPADNQAEPRVVHVPDSIAELDCDEGENFDVNVEDEEFAFNEKNRPDGYMQEFCYEVHKRLRIEFRKIGFESMVTNRWLKQHLEKNDYWLLPCHMALIAQKLGLKPRHKSYYKREGRLPSFLSCTKQGSEKRE